MTVIRKNQTLSTLSCQRAALIALPLIGALAQANNAIAQVIPSGEGTSTVVDAVGGVLEISGGQLSKDSSNLFHSFEQFDLSAEQTANFVTNAHVQNVVGSIRGGAASTIDGTLQVSGSNANLYLMNPAGILFGPNARLNLSGGITATTADGIDFAGKQFVCQSEHRLQEHRLQEHRLQQLYRCANPPFNLPRSAQVPLSTWAS